MKQSQWLSMAAIVLAGAMMAAFLLNAPAVPRSDGDEHGHGTGESAHDDHESDKGPHGGRMLSEGDLALEVTIFERGVPPEFRVYPYAAGKPLSPAEVDLTIELRRLGERVDTIRFAPQQDYLRGSREVEEPHSFDVTVSARRGSDTFRWQYETYEGRVELRDDAVRSAKIEIESVRAATIRTTLELTGQIVPNEDRMAHMIPRFPGVVKEVRKRLGDRVEKGEVLAVIQSNESLQSYEVRSQIEGTVIQKHVAPGEFVAVDEDVYTVADLSTVWIDLNVYRRDFSRLRTGQRVLLDAGEGVPEAEGTISYISPFGAPNTQTMLARVELPNPTGEWRPGLFVAGSVIVEEVEVPQAVERAALQTIRDWDVVFVREGNLFEAQPVEIGRRDAEWVEIVSGLRAGQRYAAENSFVVKAEIGKAGASHDH